MPTSHARRHRIHSAACSLLLLLGVASQLQCGGEDPVGNLTVPFELRNGLSCADFSVADVSMVLTPTGEDVDPELQFPVEGEASCESGEVTFTGIAVGQYEVAATGNAVDDAGTIVVDNVDDDRTVAEVLEEQDAESGVVVLGPSPAKLRVYWGLRVGTKQAMCSDVDTKKFYVSVGATKTSSALLEYEYDCAGKADDDLYHVAPDPQRTLDGEQAAYALIQPRDASGEPTGDNMEVCFDPPGHGRSIEIDFDCVDGVCAITGALEGSCEPEMTGTTP